MELNIRWPSSAVRPVNKVIFSAFSGPAPSKLIFLFKGMPCVHKNRLIPLLIWIWGGGVHPFPSPGPCGIKIMPVLRL